MTATETQAGAEFQEPALDASRILRERYRKSTVIPLHFFEREAENISRVCLAMAKRFRDGGRLFAFGEGAEASDARHVAVEFVHPVLVGKRALPALALTADGRTNAGVALAALGCADDILFEISADDGGDPLESLIAFAAARGHSPG